MNANKPHIEKHIIFTDAVVKEALVKINKLGPDAILFVADQEFKLVGSLTDGDVRRGLLNGLSIDDYVTDFIQSNPFFIQKNQYDLNAIQHFRKKNILILPVLNADGVIINIINLRLLKSYLPLDAVIFAGGEGRRLRPLTEHVPKPMLKVGDKPIIEHNIDWMASYGIDEIWITLKYLGNQISEYIGTGDSKKIQIQYVTETKPLGTFGAISLIDSFQEDVILVVNSDILTNIDYEDYFLSFMESGADMAVATIPYNVDIPYAVLEQNNGFVTGFKEKPRYTYYSNAGIYLVKRELLSIIPKESFYNATDFMEQLIQDGKKVYSYPIRSYWLDIGKHEDYLQAQQDIKHINLV